MSELSIYTYMTETLLCLQIFPMNVKMSAGTLVTVTNWLFGWIVTYTFNFMLQWNASGNYVDVYPLYLTTVITIMIVLLI